MMEPPYYRQMQYAFGAAALLAVLSAARAWWVRSRRYAAAARAARLCSGIILEHPWSAGLLLVCGGALIVPIALTAWAASALAPYIGGWLPFAATALCSAAASAAIALAFAASAAYFALRRFRLQPAGLAALLSALARQLAFAGAWALALARGQAGNPFLLPAALDDGSGPEVAGRRAAVFAEQAPLALAAVLPSRERAKAASAAWLAFALPLALGLLCLPALAYLGFPLPPQGPYRLAVAAACLAWWLGALLAAFRWACALVHAGAVYAYGTGSPAARERVLSKLPAELVWPAPGRPGA
ncbi:MAG: hypothetical protein KGO96_02535 [Elusimicrobia bacterium]|nr:hypothetical protein [Elusimicrobiota bacterium]MDE2236374.1 hypothetical protein [Elusimicrobiota bacterium]MDE2424772.1 hypothetical protein [Elusimicrobiota bacterium]